MRGSRSAIRNRKACRPLTRALLLDALCSRPGAPGFKGGARLALASSSACAFSLAE